MELPRSNMVELDMLVLFILHSHNTPAKNYHNAHVSMLSEHHAFTTNTHRILTWLLLGKVTPGV